MPRGRFIAFEGGEGSGKDCNISRLMEKYTGRDDIVFTREPGGTEAGERLRSFLLTPRERGIDVARELVVFVAARAILIEEVIIPALDAGKAVFSNRFHLSTLAYQIHARQRLNYLPLLEEMSRLVVQDVVPYYILLDVKPEVGLARVRSRGEELTSFDAEDIAFHARVRQGYLTHVKEFQHCVIDAGQPPETVWSEVEAEVDRLFAA
jgi:dTMP kinase